MEGERALYCAGLSRSHFLRFFRAEPRRLVPALLGRGTQLTTRLWAFDCSFVCSLLLVCALYATGVSICFSMMFIRTYVYVYIYTYIIHTHIHICIHTYICMYVYTDGYVFMMYMYACIHVYVYSCAHTGAVHNAVCAAVHVAAHLRPPRRRRYLSCGYICTCIRLCV